MDPFQRGVDVMTLVANMIGPDLPLFQVFRNGHQLDRFGRARLDDLVVTAKAHRPDLFAAIHGHGGVDGFILDMVGKRTMAYFAGYGLVDSILVEFSNEGMAVEAGLVGHVPGFPVRLLHHRPGTIVAVLAEFFREERVPQASAHDDKANQCQDDPDQVNDG